MTANKNPTPFEKRCELLADLWITYGNDPDFEDFFEYNDLALPFAYGLANNLIDYSASVKIKPFIDEAWNLLLGGAGQEDIGFEELSELMELIQE
jgi:hypothetical protein